MTTRHLALVSPANAGRDQLARYLADRGFEVFSCDQLAVVTRFAGAVLLDTPGRGDVAIAQVRSWIAARPALRVVVVTSKPAGWRALSLAHGDHLCVLAAPAFGWEIIDALRAGLPDRPAS